MKNFCENGKMEFRTLDALEPVLRDGIEIKNEEIVVYDVCREEMKKESLRYDLTKIYPANDVMPKDKEGVRELSKTFGHSHSANMAELFEVVEGETIVPMQKNEENSSVVKEVYLIRAKEGEKIVIPPNFAFSNINPNNSASIVSNWVAFETKNQYEIVKKFKGLCYYILEKNGEIIFEKNKNYESVPSLIHLKPKSLPAELEDLEFLLKPEKYADFLTIDSLYEQA
jgi:oxalate decarboxylase/phosphoglucose isomerase-like protein (cupin superfamily)